MHFAQTAYLCLLIASYNKDRSSSSYNNNNQIFLCAEDVVFYVNCYMLHI